jgi:phenylpropionate dioxygenase-like ring-hydroxylating dioxygenase large terminal subunit
MIPNQWYAGFDFGQGPGDRPVGVTRMGERLVFWRNRRQELSSQAREGDGEDG